ncbi:MAG: MarR family winged helix-turn-helix transcriptional regulator [Acetobacteraceae bacterium]
MSETVQVRRTLGFLLQDASRLMRRRFVQCSREADLRLNRSEAAVLVHVFHSPGINQTKLANYLDIETISVVRLIDSLQAAGLIERRLQSGDRRLRTLWLTAAGTAKVGQIKEVALAVRGQALVGLSEQEHERLLDLLTGIRANLASAADGATGETSEEAAA